jgi:threonine dehydrogenase-like Zn-dependent dehydrogenase
MTTMPALQLQLQPLRAAWAVTAKRWRPEAWAGGPGSPLRLTEIPRPVLPGPEWVRVRVDLAGICASDLKLLKVTGMSPVLSAWTDARQPAVLGHEIVGTVTEAGSAAGVREGERVVAEPLLSCRDKGFAPCASCRAGEDHRCERRAEPGALGCIGDGFGFNARFGGGWSQELVAPGWRCVRVPESLPDADAVLAEPVAIAVHAVMRHRPLTAQRALVIGPGTIGLSTLMALRHLSPQTEVSVAGLGTFADDLARSLGAADLLHGTRTELLDDARRVTGGVLRKPLLGRPVLDSEGSGGGFDIVYDCVGSEQTIDDALRMLRPGGRLVLVATSGKQKVDWSLVWFRELAILGTVFYAEEPNGRRAMATAVELLADARPGARMVTHRFGLEQHVPALLAAAHGPGAGAVKVAFAPNGA